MKNNKSKKAVVKKADEAIVPISIEEVQDKIIVLRGEPIILDRDVAALYGVQTKDVNRAVSNNPRKFPSGYTFVLDNQEVAELRLKILTTTQEDADNKGVKPLSSMVRYNPVAFTERGMYMLATILKSRQAEVTMIHLLR